MKAEQTWAHHSNVSVAHQGNMRLHMIVSIKFYSNSESLDKDPKQFVAFILINNIPLREV